MTEYDDVQWLRERWNQWDVIDPDRAKRLLAHIDELEAEVKMLREVEAECGRQLDRRPTIHEIAAQIAAGIASAPWSGDMIDKEIARSAYDAAEALVAEGRRRDAAVHD